MDQESSHTTLLKLGIAEMVLAGLGLVFLLTSWLLGYAIPEAKGGEFHEVEALVGQVAQVALVGMVALYVAYGLCGAWVVAHARTPEHPLHQMRSTVTLLSQIAVAVSAFLSSALFVSCVVGLPLSGAATVIVVLTARDIRMAAADQREA